MNDRHLHSMEIRKVFEYQHKKDMSNIFKTYMKVTAVSMGLSFALSSAIYCAIPDMFANDETKQSKTSVLHP